VRMVLNTALSLSRDGRPGGHINMRAHTNILSALRSDTPRSISVEAFGAEV